MSQGCHGYSDQQGHALKQVSQRPGFEFASDKECCKIQEKHKILNFSFYCWKTTSWKLELFG